MENLLKFLGVQKSMSENFEGTENEDLCEDKLEFYKTILIAKKAE